MTKVEDFCDLYAREVERLIEQAHQAACNTPGRPGRPPHVWAVGYYDRSEGFEPSVVLRTRAQALRHMVSKARKGHPWLFTPTSGFDSAEQAVANAQRTFKLMDEAHMGIDDLWAVELPVIQGHDDDEEVARG